MIVDAPTVAALVLAGVGALLGAAVLALLLRAVPRARADSETAAERGRLAGLVLAVLLVVRAAAWPLGHAVLHGYVDDLAAQGVMCAFGVARLAPRLTAWMIGLAPAAVLLLGASAWIGALATPAEAARARPARLALGLLGALLALAASAVEIAWLLAPKGGAPVTCCSTVFATLGAGGSPVSPEVLDPAAAWTLFGAWVATGIAAAALALLARSRATTGLPFSAAMALLALLELPLGWFSWREALAPRVLGLPYHPCLFELISAAPALGPAAALALLGAGALLLAGTAPLLLSAAPSTATRLRAAALGAGAVALISARLAALLHL